MPGLAMTYGLRDTREADPRATIVQRFPGRVPIYSLEYTSKWRLDLSGQGWLPRAGAGLLSLRTPE